MVNSKKMSKSSVAVIVLAILLVLSMVLGLTGAWFTDNDSNVGVDGGEITFRDNAMSVTVEAGAAANILRDENGDEDYEKTVATLADGTNDLMPGDKIEGSDITVTLTVANGKSAYYVIIQDGKYYDVNGVELTEKAATISGTSEKKYSVEEVIVPKTTDNNSQGKPYNASALNLGGVEVRMMQTENISAEDAFDYLTTDANWTVGD